MFPGPKLAIVSFRPPSRNPAEKGAAAGPLNIDWIPGQARDDKSESTRQLLKNYEAALGERDLAKQITDTQQLPAENLQQFIGSLVQFGTDAEAALKHIDDISEQEFYDPSVNAVTLMTIHASKGLEFEHVFLVAAEDGIVPSVRKNAHSKLDEERRLFYVAVTRAQETVEILHTKTRAAQPAKPSRFITELQGAVLPRTIDPNMPALERRLKRRRQKRAQTSLF